MKKKRSTGLVIHIEPDAYVVCTKGGRKIKKCRTMESAKRFAASHMEKTGGRSLSVKGARFRYVPAAKVQARATKKRPAKRRAKRRGRR